MPSASIQVTRFATPFLKVERWENVAINGVGGLASLQIGLIDANYQTVPFVSASTGLPVDDITITQPVLNTGISLAAMVLAAGYQVPILAAASGSNAGRTIGGRVLNLSTQAFAFNFSGSADGTGTNGLKPGRSGPSQSSPWQVPAGGVLDLGGFYDN